ncbi:hypothetical protein WA588_002691, partial [Blastocystis sp. NMH]
MAWMATTHSCPLCKRRIGVLIADIQSPSEYSQFLPNGKYLYTHFSSHRKAIYTMDLVPLPFYEGEVTPGQIKKHSQVKEWIQRELDTLLPGADTDFFVSLFYDLFQRYGTRNEYARERVTEVLGDYASTFLREIESYIQCNAKSIEAFDDMITYCHPSLAETIDGIPSSPKEDNYIYNYEAVASEYNEVEEELDRILSEHPSFDALADEMEKVNESLSWNIKRKHASQSYQPLQDDDDP